MQYFLQLPSPFFFHQAPVDSNEHRFQQQCIKINISDTVSDALYLYDLASRLAGGCLLGEEEEEEGRRWVVE